MCLLIGPDNVVVMDGDILETKNLNRQLFTHEDVGSYKAQCLAEKYGCQHEDQWFSFGCASFTPDDWLIGVVDNHPARMAVLETCDHAGCSAILAANETHSSEAYVYHGRWKGVAHLDPRLMFPEMATDRSGDPRRASAGCTGEAQAASPQLVTANMMAASLAMHLYVVWAQVARTLPASARDHLPHRLVQNLSKSESFKTKQ